MALFEKSVFDRRKEKLATQLHSIMSDDEVVLLYCGEPITKPGGLDQTYDFLPHPTYFWLTGFRSPGGVSFFSKQEGWIDFVKFPTREDRLWEGIAEEPVGRDLKDLPSFLENSSFSRIFKLGQTPPQEAKPPVLSEKDVLKFESIQKCINSTRRHKDREEIELIQKIAHIANKGYQKFQQLLRPGISERELQIEYEAEIKRHGAHGTPYGSIIGGGKNASILHGTPGDKKLQAHEMVLIDAGVDVYDYCVDITRVYPVTGKFTSQQKSLYDLVKNAQTMAISKCHVGTQWHEVHRASAHTIAQGLRDLNLLNCSAEDALVSEAIAVFYPHGVGHLVGLRVRDVGCPENKNPKKYYGVNLRVDLELQENFLITVEPGCYFIEALIQDNEIRKKFKDLINWQELDKWKDIGGVRIEDDILITSDVARNLTSIVEKI